jgi:formate hydrogenlyase subunit 3/multisubunit Na+/H+ antiporter MnhD subunit
VRGGLQRRALGVLFLVIALAMAGIAVAAAFAGRWVIVFAAAVLSGWLGTLAARGLRLR